MKVVMEKFVRYVAEHHSRNKPMGNGMRKENVSQAKKRLEENGTEDRRRYEMVSDR